MKKFLAILLSALFVLTMFVSCGDNKSADGSTALTAEEILTKTNEASANVKSYGLNATMELSMSAMGESVDMTMTMDCATDEDTIFVDIATAVTGQEVDGNVVTYIDLSSDPMVQYAGMGEFWVKEPVEELVAQQYKEGNMEMDLSMYSEYMKDSTVNEVEYNGVACYEISGVVDIDYMELIKNMNMDSIFGDLEAMGLPENYFEEVFEDVDPFVLVMGVDKETFLPVYCNVDMTQLMNKLMTKAMQLVMEQYGLADVEGVENLIKIDVTKCFVTCTYLDYNNVELEIPAEVIENAIEVENFDDTIAIIGGADGPTEIIAAE